MNNTDMKKFVLLAVCCLGLLSTKAESIADNRWSIVADNEIVWDVTSDKIPHRDHIEMSGLKVSTVVRYGVEADGSFYLNRGMVWPMLRTIPNNTHASLMRKMGDEVMPKVLVNIATETVNFQLSSLDLTTLTSSLALYQRTLSTNAGTRGDVLQHLLVELRRVYDHLHVLNGRTIVEGDEINSLRTAVRAHPTLYTNLLTIFCALQHVNYLCSFHYSSFFVCRYAVTTY